MNLSPVQFSNLSLTFEFNERNTTEREKGKRSLTSTHEHSTISNENNFVIKCPRYEVVINPLTNQIVKRSLQDQMRLIQEDVRFIDNKIQTKISQSALIQRLQTLIKQDISDVETVSLIWTVYGNWWANLHAYKKAIDCYNVALNAHPNNLSALIQRSLSYFCCPSTLSLSIKDLRVAVNTAPYNYHTLLALAKLCTTSKQLESARVVLVVFKYKHPQNQQFFLILSDFYLARNEVELSLKILDRLLTKQPDDLRVLNKLGNYYLNIKEYEKAFKYFKRSIEINPQDPEALFNRCFIYQQLNMNQDCLNELNALIDLYPEHGAALKLRAQFFMEQKNYQLALEDLEQWAEINFPNHEFYQMKGQCFSYLGKYELALQSFEQALEKSPISEENSNGSLDPNSDFTIDQISSEKVFNYPDPFLV